MLSLKDFMKSPSPMTEEEKQRFVEDMKKDEEQRRRRLLDESNRMFIETQQRLDNQHQAHKEMLIDVQVESARRIEAEKASARPDKWVKPDNEKEFNLKLEALRRWMISKGVKPDDDRSIILKHYPQIKDYTKASIYAELCGFDAAFYIAEATFNDFWKEQKLLKFK